MINPKEMLETLVDHLALPRKYRMFSANRLRPMAKRLFPSHASAIAWAQAGAEVRRPNLRRRTAEAAVVGW